MLTHRWHAVADSPYPWEREALDFLRQHLPDQEPVRVWANAEFVSLDGRLNEVDAIVLTERGMFLVEIKSRPGDVSGDQQEWIWRDGASEYRVPNPLRLANAKAKRLSELLKQTRAARSIRIPFIEPLIFASAPGIHLRLPAPLPLRVFGRDARLSGGGDAPGIIAALTDRSVGVEARDRVDASVARVITKAMDEIGLRPSVRADHAGDFKLGALIEDGPTWQDYDATHVSLNVRRRVRLYPVPKGVSADQRRSVLNAARREFEILDGIRHDGIITPASYHETERGPGLVFPLDLDAVRLDHFIAREAPRLDERLRLHLLRAIAEVLKYAHEKRLYHRALSPHCIYVTKAETPLPSVAIGNWSTGQRQAGTTTGSPEVPGTRHIDALLEDVRQLYVAPEIRLEAGNDASQDVFSLGAVAYHLFTGTPPADSLLARDDKLRLNGGLHISDRLSAVPVDLEGLIVDATRADVTQRIASVDEFLELLDVVEAQTMEEPELVEEMDPSEATIGDELPGGLVVRKRLGRGSCAVALLVERDGREYVLKVAASLEQNARLRAEGEVLRSLHHQNIVSMHGEPIEIGGRVCLLLDKAGDTTLARRLQQDGPLQLDFLQRFGEDLLSTLNYLHDMGTAHRDVKPDNLGVTPLGRGSRQHLVLFDFSLSREPVENIRSGTVPYLEPFLKLRRPPRWDPQAERFSAAVTLHEMATGQVPKWGDGLSDPAMLRDEVTLAADLFDSGIRDQLVAFFLRALARDPGRRFDNAQQMLDAWREVFRRVDRPVDEPVVRVDTGVDALRALFAPVVEQATHDTPLAALGVSTRGLNALERVGCTTAGQLARLSLTRVWALPGVGHKTRRELGTLAGELRARFGTSTLAASNPGGHQAGIATAGSVTTQPEPDVRAAAGPDGVPSVDTLVALLLPKRPSGAPIDSRAVPVWLGLDETTSWGPKGLSPWPNQTEVSKAINVTRARVSQLVGKARDRWRRDPRLTMVRGELVEMVRSQGGAASADEIATLRLQVRGSVQDEPHRTRHARAVVRAALDVETAQAEPRLVLQRTPSVLVVAVDDTVARWAGQLGDLAAELAMRDPLVSPDTAIAALEAMTPPDGAVVPPPSRLLRMAAAVSGTAVLSSRQELYPRGMDAARALRLTPGLLVPRDGLTVGQVHERVKSRYPEAAPLPDRPALDRVMADAGLDVEWVAEAAGGRGAYRARERYRVQVPSITSTLTRFSTRTGGTPVVLDESALEARGFEERLRKAAAEGQFLVLTTTARDMARAQQELARFGVELVDTDSLLVTAMRKEALKAGAGWDIVLRADAAPRDGLDWRQLQILVTRAMGAVTSSLLTRTGTVLLTNPGLLARYERLGLLHELHQQLGRDGGLQGIWVLVPTDGRSAQPVLNGVAVPVIGRGQWARIPDAWLRNEHRAA